MGFQIGMQTCIFVEHGKEQTMELLPKGESDGLDTSEVRTMQSRERNGTPS